METMSATYCTCPRGDDDLAGYDPLCPAHHRRGPEPRHLPADVRMLVEEIERRERDEGDWTPVGTKAARGMALLAAATTMEGHGWHKTHVRDVLALADRYLGWIETGKDPEANP